jgi:hypothetical protein
MKDESIPTFQTKKKNQRKTPNRKIKIKMGTTVYESCQTEGRTWEETEADWEGLLLHDPCKVERPRKKKREENICLLISSPLMLKN